MEYYPDSHRFNDTITNYKELSKVDCIDDNWDCQLQENFNKPRISPRHVITLGYPYYSKRSKHINRSIVLLVHRIHDQTEPESV